MEENNLISLNGYDLETPSGSKLLKGVSFNIPRGKITILKAGNGVGKTQLMKSLIRLDSKIKTHLKLNQITYLPQVESLNLKAPFILGELCSKTTLYFPKNLLDRSWNMASGGEKKRCLLARTLTQDKLLYILDEPLNHLDIETQANIIEEILNLTKVGKTFLMTGHIAMSLPAEIINLVELEKWKC